MRAFTLIELVVVIVILGLLASIAGVTYEHVVHTSQLRSAELTLASLTREANALAAAEARSTYTQEDLQHAAMDLPGGYLPSPAPTAANSPWVLGLSGADFSGAPRTIAATFANSYRQLSLALYVPGAGCAFASGTIPVQIRTWSVAGARPTDCSGFVAAKGPGFDPGTLTAPPTPAGFTMSFGADGHPTLTWSDQAGSYDIYRDGVWIGVGNGGTFHDPAGSSSSTYTVVDRPVGAAPDRPAGLPALSEGSTVLTTEPITAGSAPAVSVTWDPTAAPAGTTTVDVYRTVDGSTTRIGSVAPATGAFVDSSPAPGSATYTVVPVTPAGQQAAVPASAQVTPTPAVPTPAGGGAGSGPSVTLNGRTATIAWGAVPSAPSAPLTGYRLYRQPQGGSTWTPASVVWVGAATSTTDTPSTGGVFCYRVSAYGPGGESALSAPACGTFPAPGVSVVGPSSSTPMPGQTLPAGTTAAASASYGSSTPDKAFDGNAGTGWYPAVRSGWIQFAFPQPVTVGTVYIAVDSLPNQDTSWTVAGRLGDGTWTTIGQFSVPTGKPETINALPVTPGSYTGLRLTGLGPASDLVLYEITTSAN